MFIFRALNDGNFGLSEEILYQAIEGEDRATEAVFSKILPYLKGAANQVTLMNSSPEEFYEYLYDRFIVWFFKSKDHGSYYEPKRAPLKNWLLTLISTARVDFIKEVDSKKPVSIDRPIKQEEEISVSEVIPELKTDPVFTELSEISDIIDKSKNELDPREQKILEMLWEGEYTQNEIAEEVGVGPERVSELIRYKIRPVVKKYLQR